ncbi:uncharacterized protein TNCV_3274621 [Trichonephila clavipes]|nr:uncharacterized protein TNCV_3274621 [Trichonephila clavipes]
MKDDAPNITIEVKQFLKKTFNDERVLSHSFTQWLRRSQDLTAIDFWLWSYVKSRVNLNSSSLVESKDAICQEFSYIQTEILHTVVDGVVTRLQTNLW